MSTFDWVSLNNGISTITVDTTGDSSAEPTDNGLWIMDVDGLLDPGASTGSAEGNGLTDGSSLDEGVTVAGKQVSMRVIIIDTDRAERRRRHDEWIEFLEEKNFIIDTDWKGPYNAQYVSFVHDEDGKGDKDNYFSGTLSLVTEESW
jgi:hypothetical protein